MAVLNSLEAETKVDATHCHKNQVYSTNISSLLGFLSKSQINQWVKFSLYCFGLIVFVLLPQADHFDKVMGYTSS